MKRPLYILLPLLVAFVIRLYPHYISGLPFSADAWPLIRNAELLLENTPVQLNAEIFDGYNNYYPASSIFGNVVAETVGLKPMEAMAISLPVAGALSILVFYALVRMLYDEKTGFVASMIFATAYTHAIFTAGVTKETYANPLYLLIVFIFLHPKLGRWIKLGLFTLASLTLVSTHHLTSFMAIIVLSSVALAEIINNHKAGLAPQKHRLIFPLILIGCTALYHELYAGAGFQVPLLPSDLLSAALYQILAFSIAFHIAFNGSKSSRRRVVIECLAALIITTLIVLLTTRRSLLPGAPMLPSSYIIYGTPFIIAPALVILGVGGQNVVSKSKHSTPIFWFAAVIGVEGFASFGIAGLGFGLAYRTLNFMQPPLAILGALGLCRLYSATNKSNTKRLVKTLAIVVLMAITISNCYSVYAAVSLQERYMGYFWLYKMPEYQAGAWISNVANSQTVSADVKVSFLLKGYFDVGVDSIQGFKYLAGADVPDPQILFVYDQMIENGYVLFNSYSVDLPENWMEKLSDLNSIYSNGYVTMNAG